MKRFAISALAALAFVPAHAAITTVGSNNANTLANSIAGSGITISSAVFTTDGAQAGTFSGGTSAGLGFNSGLVLTTGVLSCIPGPNNTEDCGELNNGNFTKLSFNFTSDTGKIFFNYQFASEEYLEFVNKGFNDTFSLKLNGTNIALLPNGSGVVSIDNVNSTTNSAYYVNNPAGDAAFQYDGHTVVLTAVAEVVAGAMNTFEFFITDNGDSQLDSAVFIQAGSFSGTPTDVPEPGSIALAGLGLAALALRRRKSA